MVRVYHTRCKKLAFYLVQRINDGGQVLAHNVRMVDGTIPEPKTCIRCGSCGLNIRKDELYQGPEWMDWFIVSEPP